MTLAQQEVNLVGAPSVQLQKAFIGSWAPICSSCCMKGDRLHLQDFKAAMLHSRAWSCCKGAVAGLPLGVLTCPDIMLHLTCMPSRLLLP